MAKVTVRKETGRLIIDFTYRGVRCREQTALNDTITNRKRVEAVLVRLRASISAGSFVYSEFFPGSSLSERFETRPNAVNFAVSVPAAGAFIAESIAAVDQATPRFDEFTKTWNAEHQIEWRRSHIKVLNSTLDGHLLPEFGARPVASITKADVLTFRAKLADKPGRTGTKLSNKRINNILGVLRQIMAAAADRYDFISPCLNVKALK